MITFDPDFLHIKHVPILDLKPGAPEKPITEEPSSIPKPKFVPYPNVPSPVITEIKAPSLPAPPKPLPSTYQTPNLKGSYKSKRVFKVSIREYKNGLKVKYELRSSQIFFT